MPTDEKFTGQRLDSSTGLYYYNARYYDPTIGRFVSPDTIVPSLTNPQALNRYTYASNNPLVNVDPTGHLSWRSVAQFAAGIAKSVVETTASVVQMVVNPVQTAQAISYAVTHPIETVNAIYDSYSEKTHSAQGLGEIAGDILMTVATLGGGAALSGTARVGKTASIVEKTAVIGENMDRVGAAATKLGAETFTASSSDLPFNLVLAENRAWANSLKEAGYTVYDIGPDWARRAARTESGITPIWGPGYNTEREVFKDYPLVTLWERTSRTGGYMLWE